MRIPFSFLSDALPPLGSPLGTGVLEGGLAYRTEVFNLEGTNVLCD